MSCYLSICLLYCCETDVATTDHTRVEGRIRAAWHVKGSAMLPCDTVLPALRFGFKHVHWIVSARVWALLMARVLGLLVA